MLFLKEVKVLANFSDKTPNTIAEEEIVPLASFPMLNPNPIIEADFEGNLLYSNPATKTMFADLEKKGLKHPLFSNWKKIVETLQEKSAGNFLKEIQIGENWFIEQFFLVPGTKKIRIYFTPVNELKKTQQALEKERNLLKTVMNGAKNFHLVYLDRDFNFVGVNEAYAKTCGYKPEEMIGKNHFSLYPNEENEAIFKKVRDTGVPIEFKDKPFVFRSIRKRRNLLGLDFATHQGCLWKSGRLSIFPCGNNRAQENTN